MTPAGLGGRVRPVSPVWQLTFQGIGPAANTTLVGGVSQILLVFQALRPSREVGRQVQVHLMRGGSFYSERRIANATVSEHGLVEVLWTVPADQDLYGAAWFALTDNETDCFLGWAPARTDLWDVANPAGVVSIVPDVCAADAQSQYCQDSCPPDSVEFSSAANNSTRPVCVSISPCGPLEYTDRYTQQCQSLQPCWNTGPCLCAENQIVFQMDAPCICRQPTSQEFAPPTPTTDRWCGTNTTCPSGTYDSGTKSGLCMSLSVCEQTSEFESVRPTPTSDRRCTALTRCTEKQYQSTPPTPTSNRYCSAHTECLPTEHTSLPPTSTSNRYCQPCPAGTFPTSTSCQKFTVCPAGTVAYIGNDFYFSSNNSAAHDVTCVGCPFGKFKPVADNTVECQPWTWCQPGYHLIVVPYPWSDTVCAPCAPGTTDDRFLGTTATTARPTSDILLTANPTVPFTSMEGQVSSSTIATNISPTAAANTMDNQDPSDWRITIANEISSSAIACQACAAGASITQNTSLGPCSTHYCNAGTFSRDAALPCEPCILGQTFAARKGQSECFPTTDCGAENAFEVIAATVTSDRLCRAWTVCHYVLEAEDLVPTITSDRTCKLAPLLDLSQGKSKMFRLVAARNFSSPSVTFAPDLLKNFRANGWQVSFIGLQLPCGLSMDSETGQLEGTVFSSGRFPLAMGLMFTDTNKEIGYTRFVSVASLDINLTIEVDDCSDETCHGHTCKDDTPMDGVYECLCPSDGLYDAQCNFLSAAISSNNDNATSVLGGSAGAIATLCIVAGLATIYIRRAMKRQRRQIKTLIQSAQHTLNTEMMPTATGDKSPVNAATMLHRLEVARKWLVLDPIELGSGEFGVVHLGRLVRPGQETVQVAVKQLRGNASTDASRTFLLETYLTALLDHPHIVKVLGMYTYGLPFLVALERMTNGCLVSYLKSGRTYLKTLHLLDAARGLCEAMVYLGKVGIVHRDLAARNVLVGADLHDVKLADFGMSRDIQEKTYYRQTASERVPVKWLAPESIQRRLYTHASDVWSFGILLWELFSLGTQPYPEHTALEAAMAVASGYRMPTPALAPARMYRCMFTMWCQRPKDRPTFTAINQVIYELLESSSTQLQCPCLEVSPTDHEVIDNNNSDLVEELLVDGEPVRNTGNRRPRYLVPIDTADIDDYRKDGFLLRDVTKRPVSGRYGVSDIDMAASGFGDWCGVDIGSTAC